MGYRVAVLGASGNVGREILQILHERRFPADDVVALASEKSVGGVVSFGEDDELRVHNVVGFDFKGVDLVLASAGKAVAEIHAPRAAKAGAIVVDNSQAFRMEPDVPLVVPEINPEALARFAKRNIIANPTCTVIVVAMALKPLHDVARLRRAGVSTYQSVSGVGKAAMDELFNQTRAIFVNQPIEREEFPKQIAFNVIPQVDSFLDDGMTREEWKLQAETRKLLDPDIRVAATCVRVPVFVGHAASVVAEFERPLDEGAARRSWRAWRGGEPIGLVDHRVEEGYVTPAEIHGEDKIYVSRVRRDPSVEHGLAFWCVGDNLRKGAALNMVQIAELLVAGHLAKDRA
jgi:aspartate-semialdehyde dehydrogenase